MALKLFKEFLGELNNVSSKEGVLLCIERLAEQELDGAKVICISIDPETYDFNPARSVDEEPLREFSDYLDQGICAEPLANEEPGFIFGNSQYDIKKDEGYIIIPVIFGEVHYGIVIIATSQKTCKNAAKNLKEEIAWITQILTKLMEIYHIREEESRDLLSLVDEAKGLRNSLESVVHGVIVLDPRNVVTIFNKNSELLFGVSARNVVGQFYRDALPEEVAKYFDILVQNTLIEGTIRDYEFDVKLSNSLSLPVGVSTSLIIGKEGENEGIVAICRDMSLTKEVNRLKDLDKLKSEFVSMVSHELKNPIAVVKSSVDILLAAKRLGKDLGHEFEKKSLTTINTEIDRLSQLISDILSLSRIESEDVEVERVEIHVDELLFSVSQLFEVSKESHPIKIICDDVGKVPMDSDKIKQVLINFVNNAIKYSPNGSEITIKAEKSENWLTIAVEDKGLGIPKEQVGRIFDKFFRVSSDDREAIGGTGLGLSICQKIIDLHHGKIWVKSEHGQGSTFGFDLPLSTYQAETEQEEGTHA